MPVRKIRQIRNVAKYCPGARKFREDQNSLKMQDESWGPQFPVGRELFHTSSLILSYLLAMTSPVKAISEDQSPEKKFNLNSPKCIRSGTLVWAKLDPWPKWPGKFIPFNWYSIH